MSLAERTEAIPTFEMAVQSNDFAQQCMRALAVQNVVVLRHTLTLDECAVLVGRTNIDDDVLLDADEVEASTPRLGELSRALVDPASVEGVRTDYIVRVRDHGVGGALTRDSSLHYDNKRSTIMELRELVTRPGIRIVHQLFGAEASIGTESDGRETAAVLNTGDAWAIPQDRFIGLPIRTADGKKVFARHPAHYASSRGLRGILIQDISIPLGVVIPVPSVLAKDVRKNVHDSLNDYEQWYLEGRHGRNLIDKINALYRN